MIEFNDPILGSFNKPFNQELLNVEQKRQDSLEKAISGIESFNGTQSAGDFKNIITQLDGLDPATKDLVAQFMFGELQYDRDIKADSSKYQRAVKDLERAGINPFMVLQGLGPGNVNSNLSYRGDAYTSQEASKREQASNYLRVIGLIIGLLGGSIVSTVGKAAAVKAGTRSISRYVFK